MNPLDTAIYWIEYVVRHGSDSLRSPAMELAWWQIELLDVYLFVLFIIIFSLFLVINFVKLFFKTIKFIFFNNKKHNKTD